MFNSLKDYPIGQGIGEFIKWAIDLNDEDFDEAMKCYNVGTNCKDEEIFENGELEIIKMTPEDIETFDKL